MTASLELQYSRPVIKNRRYRNQATWPIADDPVTSRGCLRRLGGLLVGGSLLVFCGCTGSVASLSTINGPVVLNGSPFLGDPGAYVANPSGTYLGSHKIETVSYGSLIETTTTHTAQLAASESLGGQTDRAIVGLQYEVSDIYAVFSATMGVALRGDVVEYEPAEKP